MHPVKRCGIRIKCLASLLAWLLLINCAVEVRLVQKQKNNTVEEEKYPVEAASASAGSKVNEPETSDLVVRFSQTVSIQAKRSAEFSAELKQSAYVKTAVSPDIRVVLMDTSYQSYFHPSVTFVCGEKTVTLTPDSEELDTGSAVYEDPEGICILSIFRQDENPVYYGTLEVQKRDEGLLLINRLPLEQYLEAVVPGEMPSGYEEEALKAQAVCARTYAYSQIEEGHLELYDADVDDSVNFQVYNSISSQDTTSEAVRDTEGIVMKQDGELIDAYYFSTSAGVTSTDEIWGVEQASSYLQSVPCSFDSDLPWSSWSVTIPWSSVEKSVQTFFKDDSSLVMLQETKRSQSHAVTELSVQTSKDSYTVSGEYDVRKLLTPQGCSITQKNGNCVDGGSLLPSAYFTMEVNQGKDITLTGSGYGHGVGMSQNAANEMAKEGYSYEEILNYFFRDIEFCKQ